MEKPGSQPLDQLQDGPVRVIETAKLRFPWGPLDLDRLGWGHELYPLGLEVLVDRLDIPGL